MYINDNVILTLLLDEEDKKDFIFSYIAIYHIFFLINIRQII